jgi:endonuclease-8
MPEGDTIHKIANWLAPRLRERTLESVRAADPAVSRLCSGRRVSGVRALGKHLFIDLDNDKALRSHLGMYGSWHFYARGDEWRKPRRQASLVMETADVTFVCFNAREVEVVSSPSVRDRIIDSRLGPDLISEEPDPGYLVRRARQIMEPDDPLADVLLDQRVSSGIGNVYKSEVLFIERWLPQTRLQAISDRALASCFTTASDLLRRNLGGGKRVTRFEKDSAGRLWAYGRTGLPCLRCENGRIEAKRLGRHHRGTFWCPTCQNLPHQT